MGFEFPAHKPQNDLKSSRCALTESLMSCIHGAQTAENQMQTLILHWKESQCVLESDPCRASTTKGRAADGKEGDPVTSDGKLWDRPW